MYKLIILALATATTFSCSRAQYVARPPNGKDGQNCEVQQLANGALIKCANSSAVVYHGTDAPVTLGIVGYIKPCGAEFANEEIFLRMSDNSILALYDGGPGMSRLVQLAPGDYVTTDSTHSCSFTVTPDLQIINEVRQ